MPTRSRGSVPAFCMRLVAVSTGVCLLHAPAAGQSIDVTAGEQSVTLLEQFQSDVLNMLSVVDASLGPYSVEASCSWCSERPWYALGICTRTASQTWAQEFDFRQTREGLVSVLNEAEQYAGTFSSSYAPTQAWLDGLPRFSAEFDATADLVLAVQGQIKQGDGPTNRQHEEVTRALQQLSDGLRLSSEQLSQGTSAVTAFLQQQSAYRQSVRVANDASEQSAQAMLAQIEDDSKNHRCQGGVPEKFARIKADFLKSTGRISEAFQRLETSSRDVERALASLVGTVVSSQTDLQTVLDLVLAAEEDQLGGFLERLHLETAKRQWRNLAEYAARGS